MKRTLLTLLAALSSLATGNELEPKIEIAKPSRDFFQGPEFAKQFAGTYKFISADEPKVNALESEVLLKIQALFEKGQFAQAETELKLFMDTQNAEGKEISPALAFTLATLYFQSDKLDQAEKLYKITIDRHKDYRRAHKNLAFLYLSKGDMDAAYEPLLRAVQLGDTDHRTFGMMGFLYLKKEDFVAAENAYRQAYLLNPREKDWQVGLAQTLMLEENWDAAASMLHTLLKAEPENSQFSTLLANAYLGKKEPMKAAEIYEMLRLRGRLGEAQLNMLGNIYLDAGLVTLAQGSYLEALQKGQKFEPKRHLRIAKMLADFGDPESATTFLTEAEKFASKALSVDDRADILLTKVKIARAQENDQEVEHLLTQVLTLRERDGEAMVELAEIYDQRGRDAQDEKEKSAADAQAINYLKQALALNDPKTQYRANLRFGQMLVARKRFTDAVKYLDDAVAAKQALNEDTNSLQNWVRQVKLRAATEKKLDDREQKTRETQRKSLDAQMKPAPEKP